MASGTAPGPAAASPAPPAGSPPSGGTGLTSAEGPDRPYLHAAEPRWTQLADLQRVVQVARLDQVVAADGLLGLHERAVGNHVAANRGGRAGRLQRPAFDDLSALFRDLLGEAHVRLHHLLEHIGRGGGVSVLVLGDEDQIFGHADHPSGARSALAAGLLSGALLPGTLCGFSSLPTIGPPRNRQPDQPCQADRAVARSACARNACTAAAGSLAP